jgi:hypothetical protein
MLGVMAVATASLMAACTSPGTLTVQGPFTIPLPPINTTGPSQVVDLLPSIPGTCLYVLAPSGVIINGATVLVPSISLSLSGTIDLPNVRVRIPKLLVSLGRATIECNGTTLAQVAVDVSIPLSVFLRDAHLDLTTGTLTLVNPSVTITGVTLFVPGTPFALSAQITLTIQIPTTHVPLAGL